jgi:hypothetical protein
MQVRAVGNFVWYSAREGFANSTFVYLDALASHADVILTTPFSAIRLSKHLSASEVLVKEILE